MWIRSQDKTILGEFSCIYMKTPSLLKDSKVFTHREIMAERDHEEFLLGIYDTSEKAIVIISEIETNMIKGKDIYHMPKN